MDYTPNQALTQKNWKKNSSNERLEILSAVTVPRIRLFEIWWKIFYHEDGGFKYNLNYM